MTQIAKEPRSLLQWARELARRIARAGDPNSPSEKFRLGAQGRALALKLALSAAVGAVFLFGYLDLRREEARALDEFTVEQTTLASALAGTLQARVDRVLVDLRAAAVAAGSDRIDQQLRRLLGAGDLYLEADLIDDAGGPLLEIAARPDRRISDSPSLREALAKELVAARAGRIVVSPPLRRDPSAPERELRLFVAPAKGRVVALLIDGDRLFSDVGPSWSENAAPMRWIILDDGMQFCAWPPRGAPDEPPAVWRSDGANMPDDVRALLSQMAGGMRGAVTLDRAAAAALGLDRRRAVAGFAPVRVGDGAPWSIAVATSAMRVRDRTRVGAWRLAVSTLLAALLAGAFGLVVVRQQRRALALADALRLAEATAALRERSEKIVEAIPIGVLALDGEQRITTVNPYLAERGAVAGSTLAGALPRASADELAPLEALLGEARESRLPSLRAGLRVRLSSPGGAGDEPRHVDAYAVPLLRPLPDTDCFLVLHDRTETRLLEIQLARADKLATIGTLAAGIAHEVGTPLGIISGRAEQLLARIPDGETGEPTRKAVSSILGQVDKVSTTIRQLLDFARVRPIEAAAVAPMQILETARSLLEHRFRQSKVTLTVDAPPTVPAARGDAGQLEQVFVNLMMNAVDACAPGGAVRASAAARGADICFEISDDGAGIAPEHLPSVLDPFFTTKKRGQGTGLGLSIAADIVKNHGGTLAIDSELGRGTTVRVLLPSAKRGASSSGGAA